MSIEYFMKGFVMSAELLTLGSMADRLGIKIHRCEYLVRSRQIEPVGIAGRYRLFDETAVKKLRSEINKADSNGQSSN